MSLPQLLSWLLGLEWKVQEVSLTFLGPWWLLYLTSPHAAVSSECLYVTVLLRPTVEAARPPEVPKVTHYCFRSVGKSPGQPDFTGRRSGFHLLKDGAAHTYNGRGRNW